MSDLRRAVEAEAAAFTPDRVPPFETIQARRARRVRVRASGAALLAVVAVGSAVVALPQLTGSQVGLLSSGQDGRAQTTMSVFAPSTLEQIADASQIRVRGVVRSGPVTYEIAPEPAPPGADGSARPQVFSYEVVQVEVDEVLYGDGPRPGQVVPVGVAVVTLDDPDVTVADRDGLIQPGTTFPEPAGARGVFFLTAPRPLGVHGQGYEVVGFASFVSDEHAVVTGVAGPYDGTTVTRQQVTDAAARPRRW